MALNFLNFLARWIVKTGSTQQRGYAGAQNSRLTADWLTSYTSADSEIKASRKNLIARSRDNERNSEYGAKYFKLVDNNVLGACGIKLQMKVTHPDGTSDKFANKHIEEAWDDQCRPENFTVSGDTSKRLAERLVLRAAARDSGALVRILRGFPNKRRYAIQLIEIDQLDHDMDGMFGQNEVRMGIELNEWHKPVAYHVFSDHPGDLQHRSKRRKLRIPAEDLIHVYLPTRIGQSVGVPWMAPSILPLRMLAGYEEAELIAAREAACKGAAIENTTPDQYSGEVDSQGRELQDMEPGMTLNLAPGQKYVPIDPNHPNTAFGEFVKSKLRGTASGLGVSYVSLANDLEGVNFSSIRQGVLEEREEWKGLQEWFIESFENRLFEDWLGFQLAMGLIKTLNGNPLPATKFDYFNKKQFKPRRWDWVDPEKDIKADILAVGARLKSRRKVIEDDGGDIEDVDADFAADTVTSAIDTASVYTPDSQPEPEPDTEPMRTARQHNVGKTGEVSIKPTP
jgi:lambda family phage portal protein